MARPSETRKPEGPYNPGTHHSGRPRVQRRIPRNPGRPQTTNRHQLREAEAGRVKGNGLLHAGHQLPRSEGRGSLSTPVQPTSRRHNAEEPEPMLPVTPQGAQPDSGRETQCTTGTAETAQQITARMGPISEEPDDAKDDFVAGDRTQPGPPTKGKTNPRPHGPQTDPTDSRTKEEWCQPGRGAATTYQKHVPNDHS